MFLTAPEPVLARDYPFAQCLAVFALRRVRGCKKKPAGAGVEVPVYARRIISAVALVVNFELYCPLCYNRCARFVDRDH